MLKHLQIPHLITWVLFLSGTCLAQSFEPQVFLTAKTNLAYDVHSADIDGDGDMDVLSASRFQNKIAWYENDGSLEFGKQQIIFSDPQPYVAWISIIALDMDGDGDVDVLSASNLEFSYDDHIVWYENDGNGVFGPQIVISTMIDNVISVISSDIDGDGDLDVLSASTTDDKLAWYENNGSGIFGMQQIISTEIESIRSIYSSDMDGDGDMDVLIASAADKISWMENDGVGSFGEELIISTMVDLANTVFASDLDGDGDMDVLSTSVHDNKIAWYENNGLGEFGSQQIISIGAVYASSLYTADLDNDGDMDVVSATLESDKIAWYENDGLGGFGMEQVISTAAHDAIVVFASDLNADGNIDVLSASEDDGKIAWYENNGSAEFGSQNRITSNAKTAKSVYASDLDGDGDLDVLSASELGSLVAWYENDGSGICGKMQVITTSAIGANSVYTSDLDGDGDMDVLSASRVDGKIAWYENDGSAEFGELQVINDNAINAKCVFAADLDADGDIDVLSAVSSSISWNENDGSGTFGSEQLISTFSNAVFSVLATDIDGDSDLDVVASFVGKVSWYENDGLGGFSAQQVITTELDDARSIHSADLDGDGDMDVLTVSTFHDKIMWYQNDGMGVFGTEQIISTLTTSSPIGVYSSDLDGDGDMDVISALYGNNDIVWFENIGFGNFGTQQIISSENNSAWSVYAADLDGDGDPEVISASSGWGLIATHENVIGEGCTDPSACNFQSDVWTDNGTCCFSNCGCTDPIAENFDNTASCEDFSCEYIFGCNDDNAANFDSLATADDGSCEYLISGVVFHDDNENGTYGFNENGVPFQNITLLPDSITAITNNDGEFQILVGPGDYTLEIDDNILFPFNTTPISVDLFISYGSSNSTTNPAVEFGISAEQPFYNSLVHLYPFGSGYPCDENRNHSIWFHNMSNLPLNGIVEFEYDSLFQGHFEDTPIDSANGNIVWMSFEDLLPGHIGIFKIDLHTPTADFIGEFLTSSTRIWGLYNEDTVAYGEKTIEVEVTCAYDPNDKHVSPIGYSEMHYIENDTILEYLVRFQNTGNAPATDIHIIDTLDANLDISSFELVVNSHSVFTTINPITREVDFFFQDIMLPDSVNYEPESHGLVSFKIRPTSNLPLLTELNNTAHIFFDNNPPIVTNNTWSTIYNCSLFEVSFEEDFALLTASDGDNYQWYIDGEPIQGATDQEYIATEDGDYSVEISINFPCSQETSSIYVVVSSIDEINNSSIVLFPNPMTQSAVIDLGEIKGKIILEIFDLKGSLVRSENLELNSGILNLERRNLSAGQYLLRIRSTEGSAEMKFVIE